MRATAGFPISLAEAHRFPSTNISRSSRQAFSRIATLIERGFCKGNFIDYLPATCLQIPDPRQAYSQPSGAPGSSHIRHQINLNAAAVACRRYSASSGRDRDFKRGDVDHACEVTKHRVQIIGPLCWMLLVTTNPASALALSSDATRQVNGYPTLRIVFHHARANWMMMVMEDCLH